MFLEHSSHLKLRWQSLQWIDKHIDEHSVRIMPTTSSNLKLETQLFEALKSFYPGIQKEKWVGKSLVTL